MQRATACKNMSKVIKITPEHGSNEHFSIYYYFAEFEQGFDCWDIYTQTTQNY